MTNRANWVALLASGWLSACCATSGSKVDAGSDLAVEPREPCTIGSVHIANRAANPSDPSQCCNVTLNPSGWSARLVDGGFVANLVPLGQGGPAAIAGNFNGDRFSDLAVLPVFGDQLYVFINQAGRFGAPTLYTVAEGSADLAAVDLNHDGFDDLVIDNATDPNVGATLSVLMNRGDGTFAPAVTYPSINNGGRSIAVGDFNGDGTPDVVLAWGLFFAGIGNGALKPGSYTGTGKNGPLAAGDLNGDGILDLAVGTWEAPDPGTITVSLGRGSGDFEFSSDYASPSLYDYDLASGDFDGDGIADLALLSPDHAGIASVDVGVTFLKGVGNGTFGSPIWIPFSNADFTSGFASADLAGDQGRELLVTTGNFIGQLTLSDGGGAIVPMISGPWVTRWMYRSSVGDFNGDGAQDLAAVTSTGGIAVYVNGCP